MRQLLDRWFGWRRDWCPHNRQLAFWTDPPVAAVAIVVLVSLALSGGWLALWLAVEGAVVWSMVISVNKGQTKGWRVTGDGLERLLWGLPPVCYPWSRLRGMVEGRRQHTLLTDDGPLELPAAGRGAEELRQAVRAGLERRAVPSQLLSETQLSELLGLEPGETLRLGPPKEVAPLLQLVVLQAGVQVLMRMPSGPARIVAFVLLLVLALTVLPRLPVPGQGALEVGGHGFCWGRRRHVRWDEVVNVAEHAYGYLVQTRRGSFYLRGDEAARVAAAIRQVLNLKRGGRLLPRMTDIPDAALSRAESVDVSAERGLSRTDGGDR